MRNFRQGFHGKAESEGSRMQIFELRNTNDLDWMIINLKKVLIIENEKIYARNCIYYFEHEGYEVLTAEDEQIGMDVFTAQ
ncbi:hypothetical protein V7014_18975 [Bacillus sp. JJ722]